MLKLNKIWIGASVATILTGIHLLLPAQSMGTPGEFAVTDAGAASYTLPIYTAPGTGNLDVKLALQYNSQSSNGVFGVGWSLTGVSSITRCPKTIAEEGERIGVKNDATDIFCLDGQKLRAVSGVYGANGTTYRTARESYSQITSLGTQGSGPVSFTVQTKSGTVMYFGVTADSRLERPSTNTPRVWMVNQITDRFNNSIAFSYTKDLTLGEQLLQEVRYGNGKVKLNYEARPTNDPIIKYDDGVQFGSSNSRVSKVEIFDEPVVSGARQLRLFKEYRMAYVQSGATRRSLLYSIQECAATGNCLPQVSLAYHNTNQVAFVTGGSNNFNSGEKVRAADFAGKGKQVAVTEFDLLAKVGSTIPFALAKFSLYDVDGDSKTDVHYQMPIESESANAPLERLFLSSTGLISAPPNATDMGGCYADINGDGIAEEIRVRPVAQGGDSDPHVYVYISESLTNTGSLLRLKFNFDECRVADLNGDGRAEVIIGSNIVTYRNGVFQHFEATDLLNSWSYGLILADFNGDGKTDFLRTVNTDFGYSPLDYSISTGNIAIQPAWNYVSITPSAVAQIALCVGDFNGDGRSDIMSSGITGNLKLFLSNGNSFTEVITSIPLYNFLTCGDFNGDGLTDIAVVGSYYFSSTPGAVDVLKEVNNGLGHISKVEYKSITDDTIYTRLSGAVRPQVDLQSPIQVVTRSQTGNPTQGWNATSYRYEGLRADLHRRGTLGFKTVISRNEGTDISVATTYHHDYPRIGLKQTSQKYKGSVTAPQVLETNSYLYDPRGLAGAGSAHTALYAQVPLASIETKRFELGSGAFVGWSKEDFNPSSSRIDVHGNVTQSVMQQLDAGGAATSRKTATHTYTNDTARWLLGQLTSSSVRSENLRGLPATVAAPVADAALQKGN